MKFINFGKIKKAVKDIVNSIFSENKKAVTITTVVTPQINNEMFKRRLGGYKRFSHKLVSVSGKRKTIYRGFNKPHLPGFKMIIGKTLFEVKENELYTG